MERVGCARRSVSMLCFSLVLMLVCIAPLGASTVVHLAWDANTEVDLAGYRLLYGTTSGSYTNTIEIGNQTAYDVIDLNSATTYYFVVVAYDDAGNVSAHSNEISARPIVLAPQPAIGVTDSPDPVAAGSTITYTLAYSNTGNVDATGVTLTDPVPPNTTFVAATGGGTLSGGVVTWSPGTLAAGSSGSVQMAVRVASGLANGTIITNGSYALRSNESATVGGPGVTTTVTSTPVLAVLSTDSPDPVAAGANLTYALTYSNSGNATATGLTVSDTLPANTVFVSAAGGAVPQAGVVSWPVANLSPGASGSVTLTVRVQSPLANGTIIHNNVYSITSAENGRTSGPDDTTTVSSAPILSVAKTADAGSVAPGANLTYTLTYGNAGNANASGVVLSDAVPANTTFVSATGGGTLAGGVVTWSVGALNAGASGSVQLVVRVASPLANGTVISNSTYSIDSNETPAVTGASVGTTVSSAPILSVAKTAGAGSVAPGANLTYTLTYGNAGNANASGVVLSDTVPANTTFVSATGGGALASGVVTWSVGALNAGASGSVQLVVRVASPLANGTVISNSTYGIDSDQTSPVGGAPVATTVTAISSPTVDSAVELTSGSIYILRPGVHDIRVVGTGFQQGAALTLSPGVTSGPATFIDATRLTATITVSPTAALGPVNVSVTNPDQGAGTKNRALKVVKSPDFNRNCSTDGLDLNTLARSWGKVSTDPGFITEADVNGDNLIDGEDLDVLATFFGRESTACP